jgi:hypothetical protein
MHIKDDFCMYLVFSWAFEQLLPIGKLQTQI